MQSFLDTGYERKCRFPESFFYTTMYVYLSCVAGYTIFPIRIDYTLTFGGNWYLGINLIPFASIYDTYVNTVYMGMNARIGISQIIGNIIMFIPLGCLYPLCSKYHVTWKRMIYTAFILSLSIELCQLLQNIFYRAAYRSADVDDSYGTQLADLLDTHYF